MMKNEISKELQAINDALFAYSQKHGSDVAIICNVVAFDDESNVIDDMFWILGDKPVLDTMSEQLFEDIEKNNFDEIW
jgi:hypothetical protein